MRRTTHRLSTRKHSPARLRLILEQLEDRCMPSVTGFSEIDQSNNNLLNDLGTAGTDLLRVSDAAYANGINTPGMGGGAPTFVAGSRLVSNTVSNQATTLFGNTDINTVNSNGLSDFGYTFGQFMDHDMDLTPTLSGKITAASWSAGTATITVADGLFQAGNAVTISGTPGFNGTGFIILTASAPGMGATTFTFALATDPGATTTLGVVANNTSKDGANGFPIPADAVHTPTSPLPDPIGSLAMSRSVYNLATGLVAGTPREQINANTSFLDLSQVYGSTGFIASALRTGIGGKLKSSPGLDTITGTADDLLPFNNSTYFSTAQIAALGMANDTHVVSNDDLFAAGDVRANETTELSSLHTLFLRNHNRLAAALATQNPANFGLTEWSDNNLYQEARKLNIAQYQNIVYNGYLPALLGPTAIAAYSGYDDTVDPSIANEFSTVAFRFGHSLLNNTVPRHNNDGSDAGELTLLQSFFNPHFLTPGQTGYTDVGAVLKGDADSTAQEMDEMGVSAIRNLLFGNSGVGEDLIARDLWRAHDNGIGTYNQVRIAYGLAPITDTGGGVFEDYVEGQPFHGFEQISSDPAVVTKLVTAYTGPTRATFLANGKFAGSIDPFAAGIAEDHVPGSNLGLLFHTILVDQFERLRDGDRFFHLNYAFTAAEQSLIGAGNTLTNVIKANTTITNLQDNVFFDRSVLIYNAPAAGANISVIAALGVVTIIDNDNGHILAVRSLNSVTRILLNGSNTGADVFNIFVASANGGIENGIFAYGGGGSGDRINVFGRLLQQDTFIVTGSDYSPDIVNVNVNGNEIVSFGFETRRIVTLFGNDIITDPDLLATIVALWNPLSDN